MSLHVSPKVAGSSEPQESLRTRFTKHLFVVERFPDDDRRRKVTVSRLAARRARAHSVNALKVLRTLPTTGPPGAPFEINDRAHVDTVLAYRGNACLY